MYTELVEGDNGKVRPQDSSSAPVAGIRKLLIDVSDVIHVDLFCYCTLVFCLTVPFYVLYLYSEAANFLGLLKNI